MRGFKLLGLSLLTLVALIGVACDAESKPATADATATPTNVSTNESTNTGDTGAGSGGGAIQEFSVADGNFAVLISDQENAIGDFVHLWVEINKVGVFSLDTNEWIEIEVPEDTQAVDLTQFTGDDATSLVQSMLPDGEYGQIFVHVEDVEGVLVAGGAVSVKLPSSKLKLNQPFTVGSDEVTSFVFDISVIAAGNERSGVKYILKPIAGESGANKSYERKSDDGRSELGVAIVADANGASGVTVTDEAGVPVAGAEVELEVKLGKLTTDAEGQVTFGVPAGTTEIKIKAEVKESDGPEREGELHLVVGETGDGVAPEFAIDYFAENTALTISFVGELTAGAPLTLLVTNVAVEPVVGAEVEVKIEIAAGVTGEDGTLAVVIPDGAGDVEAQAHTADARGDSEREPRGRGDDAKGDRGEIRATEGAANGGDRGQSGSGRGETLNADDLRVEVDGQVSAGAEITIVVTDANGAPAVGAAVELNDVDAGVTDTDGKLVATVPADAEKVEIDAKLGDAEGEVHVAF